MNIKNISSVTNILDLMNGNGVFMDLGEELFDDYWQNYLTREMSKAAELKNSPYSNLKQYKIYKNIS